MTMTSRQLADACGAELLCGRADAPIRSAANLDEALADQVTFVAHPRYLDKLAALLQAARSVTVAIMEVPCCSGLLKLVLEARERLGDQPAVELLVVGIEGEIKDRRTL